jgi:hypothetical protein
MRSLRLAAAATFGCLITAPVSAQPSSGGMAGVTVSAMTIEQDTTASIAASIGYRLNAIVALGIELTFVPSFESHVPDFPTILDGAFNTAEGFGLSPLIFPPPEFTVEAQGGRATIFTGNLRLAIPTPWPRMSPYLVGGAGVGNVRNEFQYTVTFPRGFQPGPGGAIFVVPPITESIRLTTTDFAMTLGGGVSLLVLDRWSIDADVRYLGVVGDRDIHTGRYGGGLTFRF